MPIFCSDRGGCRALYPDERLDRRYELKSLGHAQSVIEVEDQAIAVYDIYRGEGFIRKGCHSDLSVKEC